VNVIELRISNIGGVEAFELRPDGSHVVIGGKNGAGKSTVLRAIAGALGGARERGAMPLREGATDGEVVLDLGDLVVRWRTNDRGNDSLVVENHEGARYKSPQAMLSRLFGARTFDPLAFVSMSPKAQASTLADLVGVDLEHLDAERGAAFAQRRDAKRDAKELEAQAAGFDVPDGTPDEPINIADLVARLQDAERRNTDLERGRRDLELASVEFERFVAARDNIERSWSSRCEDARDEDRADERRILAQIEELQERLTLARTLPRYRRAEQARDRDLDAADARTNAALAERERLAEALEGRREIDLAPFEQTLAEAEDTNRAVEARRARERVEARAAEKRAKTDALSARIAEIDEQTRAAIAAADLPVEGLSLEDGVVTWQGRPLSVLSSSEQLRVSVALGIAAHPEIAVMLIDRWGDLDDDRRAMVREMATAAGVQVWSTVVGERDEDITVTIREGRIAAGVDAGADRV